MDFMVALLQRLVKDPGKHMEQAVEESYNSTLKPWHGWISSAAFKVFRHSCSFATFFLSDFIAYESQTL